MNIKNLKPYIKNLMFDFRQFGIRVVFMRMLNLLRYLDISQIYRSAYRRLSWAYAARIGWCPAFLSYIVPKPKNQVRRYIPPHLGLTKTMELLNKRNVKYVMLRWYEDLPDWPAGEDIDILVAEEDLHKLDDISVWYSKEHPVDIYTDTAKQGWNGISYYPLDIARKMLRDRISVHDVFYIPSPTHQFFSLAYHAVMRKGAGSGVPLEASAARMDCPDHDYVDVLQQKMDAIEFSTELTIENLWHVLFEHNWLPKQDTVALFSKYNSWLKTKLEIPELEIEKGDFLLFILRDQIDKDGLNTVINTWFETHKNSLTPIFDYQLNTDEMQRAQAFIRGGDWGRGSYPQSGGGPYRFVGFFDYKPESVTAKERKQFPQLNNAKYRIKDDLRNTINRNAPWFKAYNGVHAPDNQNEAMEFLRECLDPATFEQLTQKIQKHFDRCSDPKHPVIRKFDNFGTRSKVELVEWQGSTAVKKTFKIGQEKFFDREVFAHTVLSQKTNVVPKALEIGDGYLIIPYYEEVPLTAQLTDPQKDDIIQFLKLIFEEGYFLVDFNPNNVMLTSNGDIKCIDFEFLQKYTNKPNTFAASYDVVGVPKSVQDDIDLPIGYSIKRLQYENIWQPLLGPVA
jgi:hypothetical protein